MLRMKQIVKKLSMKNVQKESIQSIVNNQYNMISPEFDVTNLKNATRRPTNTVMGKESVCIMFRNFPIT